MCLDILIPFSYTSTQFRPVWVDSLESDFAFIPSRRLATPVKTISRVFCAWITILMLDAEPARCQYHAIADSAIKLTSQKQYEQAEQLLKNGIEEFKHPPALLRILAQTYVQMKDLDKAIEAYLRSAQVDSCDSCYADYEQAAKLALKANRFDKARGYLVLAERNGSPTARDRIAQAFFDEGEVHIKRLEYEEALDLYENCLDLRSDTLIYHRILYSHYMLQHYDDVIAIADSASRRYPNFRTPHMLAATVYLSRANDLYDKGDYSDAVRFYRFSIEQIADNVEAECGLASSYDKLNDTLKAVQHYERAFQIGQMRLQGYLDAGSFFLRAGRLSKASEVVQHGINRFSTSAELWSLMGGIYRALGSLKEASYCDSIAGIYSARRKIIGNLDPTAEYRKHFPWLSAATEKPDGLSLESPNAAHDTTKAPPDFVVVERQPVPQKVVQPAFPEIAKQLGVEGTVIIKLWVNTAGKVRRAVIVQSDADLFNEAALAAAIQWEFSPAMSTNGPVAVWVSIPFRFRIEE